AELDSIVEQVGALVRDQEAPPQQWRDSLRQLTRRWDRFMRNLAAATDLGSYYEVLVGVVGALPPLPVPQRLYRSLSAVLEPAQGRSPRWLVARVWEAVQARGAVPMVLRFRDGQPVLLLTDKIGVPVFVVVYADRESVEYVALAELVNFAADKGADVSPEDVARIEELPETPAAAGGAPEHEQRLAGVEEDAQNPPPPESPPPTALEAAAAAPAAEVVVAAQETTQAVDEQAVRRQDLKRAADVGTPRQVLKRRRLQEPER